MTRLAFVTSVIFMLLLSSATYAENNNKSLKLQSNPPVTILREKSGAPAFYALDRKGNYIPVDSHYASLSLDTAVEGAKRLVCGSRVAAETVTVSVGFASVTWFVAQLCGKNSVPSGT